MHQFSLKSEEEVFLGKAVKLHSLLEAEREKVIVSLKQNFKDLTTKYRQRILNQELEEGDPVELLVAAVYSVSYDQNIRPEKRPFLSFPWVVADILGQIKMKNCRNPPKTSEANIHRELGESAQKLMVDQTFSMKTIVQEKNHVLLKIRESIETKMGKEIVSVTAYGSSSVFLCEEESDLDICIQPLAAEFGLGIVKDEEAFQQLSDAEKSRHFLRMFVSPHVDEVLDTKVDLTTSDIPLIKGVIRDSSGSTSIDITCNRVGLLKTKCLIQLYEDNPDLWPVFFIIIKWARHSGLIKFMDDTDNRPFLTAEMYAIVIHLLKLSPSSNPNHKSILEQDLTKTFCSISEIKPDFSKVGENLHRFFRLGQLLKGKGSITISWPIHGDVPNVEIEEARADKFAKACSQALHCLLHTRDVQRVLKNAFDCTATQTSVEKKLPLSLSNSMSSAPGFHAARLGRLSGATVRLMEEAGEDRLVLRAEGSRASLAELRTELRELAVSKRALVVGVPSRQASRYFLAGSTVMLVKGCNNSQARLGFEDSCGGYQALHAAQQRSGPVLRYTAPAQLLEPADWVERHATPAITTVLTRQLAQLQPSHASSLEVNVRFGTFYTVDISDSLPKTQKTLSLEEFQETCERGRNMRKTLDRGAFSKVKKTRTNQKFQMTTLRKGKNRTPDIADNKKAKLSKKKQKKGISMSYSTGILNPEVTRGQGQSQIEAAEKVYRQALKNLGFKLTEDESPSRRFIYMEHWKVVVNASTGYEIQLNLDKDLNFISMKERNLSWVHGTIFHGNKVVDLLLFPFSSNFADGADDQFSHSRARHSVDGADCRRDS